MLFGGAGIVGFSAEEFELGDDGVELGDVCLADELLLTEIVEPGATLLKSFIGLKLGTDNGECECALLIESSGGEKIVPG